MVRKSTEVTEEKVNVEQTADIERVEKVKEEPQKKYVVVYDFKDLKDNDRVYIKNDPYPAEGAKKPTADRIKELSSTKNKMKKVLIKEQV